MDSFKPAGLARAAPALAPLAQFDAPLAFAASVTLDPRLQPRSGRAHVTVDAGKAQIGDGVLPFLSAELDAALAEGGDVTAHLVKLELQARPDAPRTTVTATLAAHPAGGQYAASVVLDLDRVAFADLGPMWPVGLGGKGTRPWITKNITAGSAHDLHVEAALTAPADLSNADLVSLSGGLEGSDLTVHWLRPVPPIEHGEAHLAFVDPDTINIAVTAGREAVGAQGIAVKGGNVRLTGLAAKDQFADIDADLAGRLADLLTLLKNPKIKLLDKAKIELRDPGGTFAGHIAVGHLPLEDNVSIDALQIKTRTHLADVRLGAIVAGKDVDRGTLDLDASNDGMHLQGTVRFAAIPLGLVADMDFRSGPASQVLVKVSADGTADERQLTAAGLDPGGVIAGPVSFRLGYESRRSGAGQIDLHADLSRTAVTVARAGFRKAPGTPVTGDVRVRLDHDRLAAVDRIHVVGDGILIDGAADVADGRPSVLRMSEIRIGTTTNAHGEVRLPAKPGEGYGVTLVGPSLDISGLTAKGGSSSNAGPSGSGPSGTGSSGAGSSGGGPARINARDDTPGTRFDVDVRLDRIVLGHGRSLDGVVARVENDGVVTRRAELSGRTAPAAPFRVTIEPVVGGRRLRGDVRDLGALLSTGDVLDELNGGHLVVSGDFNDRSPGHVLTAQVNLDGFRVRGQAALGKILQAMTLYGLVDVLSGPGLNFDRLDMPLRYSDGVVSTDALHAYSASLGLTAKGSIDLGRKVADIEGTVVPAYFFNSLPGRIPLLGTVFSPERGGGVFAATYSVRGPLDNPSIGVNPLAVLTPGFLRGLFGIFDGKPGK